MNSRREGAALRSLLATLCAFALIVGDTFAYNLSDGQAPASSAQSPAAKIPPDQLDSLVAPIALYPDPLLAQTLAASTYPLEIIQLQQWLAKNKNLKDKALADAVASEVPLDRAKSEDAKADESMKECNYDSNPQDNNDHRKNQ